jgi:hypothetical protein
MEKPAVPMWDHEQGKWYFDGELYENPYQAEHLYTNALLKYVDYLESKIEAMEAQIEHLATVIED